MMKRLTIYLLTVIALCATACSSSSDNELQLTSAVEARERGCEDAKALCKANYKTEKDLHAALLAVKSREWSLRQRGDTVAAGAYMEGFKTQLFESDKQLADKVF